jgi:hypothetical protein
MRKATLEKILKILQSAEDNGKVVCIKKKDYEYILERINAQLQEKEEEEEKDQETQKVASYFFARKWMNPVNKGRLVREIKELFIPHLKSNGIPLQEIPFVMDYYFQRRGKWVYDRKDAHLFIRYFGEIYNDYKRKSDKTAGIEVSIPEL